MRLAVPQTMRLGGTWLGVAVMAAAISLGPGGAPAQQPAPYVWRNVVIRGGGFVSGIVFSRAQKDLVYARTDVGGAYRSEDGGERWRPITDGIGRKDASFTGIESLALDPSDANKVYLAAGLYTAEWGGPSAILRSADKGRSWARTVMPFKMGGNDDGRNCGEKLAVDPNLGSVLFFGSRRAGLWKSRDAGATWAHVDSFPVKSSVDGAWQKVGISFVLFDGPSGTKGGVTPGIYVGVAQAGANLYHSVDGGVTWKSVPGTPSTMFPSHAALSSAGAVYFTFIDNIGPNGISDGAVLRFGSKDGTWTDVSPVKPGANGQRKFGFGGLAIDAEHPDTLMVTTLDRWWPTDGIFRTTDAGKHWKELNTDAVFGAKAAPWVYWHKDTTGGTGWMNDIAIDPFNSSKVMYTTGEGIWGSADVTSADKGKPTHWGFPDEGLEETVVLSLISPPEGAHLLSGVGDLGGFRHDDLNASPADGFFFDPQLNDTDSLDFAAAKPLTIVRAGRGDDKVVHAAVSTDGGVKWTALASEVPTSKHGGGRAAISADAVVVVWTPERGDAYRTSDRGRSWARCAGLPDGMRVVSDRVNPAKFYSFDSKAGKLYVSVDGARTFAQRADPLFVPGDHTWIAAAPDGEGDLWIGTASKLLHSRDTGVTFGAVGGLTDTYSLGFGKAAPGRNYSALFAVGAIDKADGLFRSDDAGKHWMRIDDAAHEFGWIRTAIGDPRIYGRVYLGTGGRGVIYGEPNATPKVPPATAANR